MTNSLKKIYLKSPVNYETKKKKKEFIPRNKNRKHLLPPLVASEKNWRWNVEPFYKQLIEKIRKRQ